MKPIAIVVGRGNYNELGLIRSCGEAGMKVLFLAPSDMVVPVYKSRYVDKWMDVDTSEREKVEVVLIQECKPENEYVIFPGGDEPAIIVEEILRGGGFDNISGPESKRGMTVLMDKSWMSKIAREAGLRVADFEVIEESAERISIAYPFILKPLVSASGEKGDISVCRSESDLHAAMGRFRAHHTSSIMVQRLVEGEGLAEYAVCGVVDRNGDIKFGGIVEKHHIYGNGSTIYGTLRPDVPDELRNGIERFLKECGYKGIFDIEFLKNKEGYWFIECNFRNGAYGYACTASGMNLCAEFAGIGYKKRERRKVKFVEERTELYRMIKKEIGIGKFIRLVFGCDICLWWNSRDWRPLVRKVRMSK